jgi:hypothetical protein
MGGWILGGCLTSSISCTLVLLVMYPGYCTTSGSSKSTVFRGLLDSFGQEKLVDLLNNGSAAS